MASLRQRISHLTARTIAEMAHGVNGLECWSGRHQNSFFAQIVAQPERGANGLSDSLNPGEPPWTCHAAGEISSFGVHDSHSALAQQNEVGLGGGMLPHIHVHGRRDDYRSLRGERCSGEKVI